MPFDRKDNDLTKSFALPNGAATTNSAGLDLGHVAPGEMLVDHELVVTIPACTTGELADGQVITYTVRHDSASDFSGDSILLDNIAVQTGAGGAGALGSTVRLRLPPSCKRYVRVRAVKTGATNASTKSAEVSLRF